MYKRIKLATVTVSEVPVCNLEYVTMQAYKDFVRVISEDGRATGVPNSYVEDVHIPIERFCSEEFGETLLAIHPDVKKELAVVKEPTLVAALQKEHEQQCNEIQGLLSASRERVKKCEQARWYTRLKWVFTGVIT